MKITKTFDFDAAHYLPNVDDGHKCKRMHGHTYRVRLEVSGPVDPRLGWIIDFERLNHAIARVHGVLDHRTLNEVPGLENPTSEVLAAWLLAKFVAEENQNLGLLRGAYVESVTVYESSTTSCTATRGDLD